MKRGTPRPFPLPIIIDNREQLPFEFAGLWADKKDGGGPIEVTTEWGTLASGDYSLAGHTGSVAVERKSLADLFGTVGQGRERFIRELARLNELDCAAVVIEADWKMIFDDPPEWSTLSPKVVFRSVLSWSQRYRNVAWWPMPGRAAAAATTFRILERYYKNLTAGDKA